jgi:hypothetical protein
MAFISQVAINKPNIFSKDAWRVISSHRYVGNDIKKRTELSLAGSLRFLDNAGGAFPVREALTAIHDQLTA